MPEPLIWQQAKVSGQTPSARHGHSFSKVGDKYIMFGGVDNITRGKKVGPNNDVFSLKVAKWECVWNHEQTKGDEPMPRTQHAACEIPGNVLFIFGGYYSTTQRFNDAYLLHADTMEWKQIPGQNSQGEPTNAESTMGAPDPRANCSCNLIGNKIYVFGGHGGIGYQRRSFNDLYTLDIQTWKWQHLELQGTCPEARQGHQACTLKNKLLVYGGWSQDSQYADVWVFDTIEQTWVDVEIPYDIPRWNHCCILVHAIPNWKFFVFGGSIGYFDEGSQRNLGKFSSDTIVLDIQFLENEKNTFSWWKCELQDELESPLQQPYMPKPREHSAMIYDADESRLLIFGGWNNNWLGDLHSLNVSLIVGPPYAISAINPPLGPLTGNTESIIEGIGFMSTSSIDIKFICGKQILSIVGDFIDEQHISCRTPSFENIGPKEAEVRLSLKGGDLTTTFTTFKYFMNTRANKSLAYGPGVLDANAANVPAVFVIQARNDLNQNRTSGRDHFIVKVYKEPTEEGGEKVMIDNQLEDMQNGTYQITYTIDKGPVIVEVMFEDEKNEISHIRGSPFKANVKEKSSARHNELTGPQMSSFITQSQHELDEFIKETQNGIQIKNKNFSEDVKGLLKIKGHLQDIEQRSDSIYLKLDTLEEVLRMFELNGQPRESDCKKRNKTCDNWLALQRAAREARKEVAPAVQLEGDKCKNDIKAFEEELKQYAANLKKQPFQKYECGVADAMKNIEQIDEEWDKHEKNLSRLDFLAQNFGFPENIVNCQKQLEAIDQDVTNMKQLWKHIDSCFTFFEEYLGTTWNKVQSLDWEENVKTLMKNLKEIKVDRKSNVFLGINEDIKNWLTFLPLVSQLKEDCMLERHWNSLKKIINAQFTINAQFKLQNIWDLQLHKFSEQVEDITDQARQEAKMQKTIDKITETWEEVVFEKIQHKNTQIMLLKLSEENFETLEEHQVSVNNMFSSRFRDTFIKELEFWRTSLSNISEVTTVLAEVQRTWAFLENLFIHSEEVKKELPDESEKFVNIDKDVKQVLENGQQNDNVKKFCNQTGLLHKLEGVQKQLNLCEKALQEFMDGKRKSFPRFYFVSTMDLLDILSNGNTPAKIMKHMPKVFQAVEELQLEDSTSASERPWAKAMKASVGIEVVQFKQELKLIGKVEVYLQDVINAMKKSLLMIAEDSYKRRTSKKRDDWLQDDPAQITLLINQCKWVNDTEEAFQKSSLKPYYQSVVDGLTALIKMVQGKLEKPVRTKIMTMITLDTHNRDIIDKLIAEGVKNPTEFQWQSQLKSYWDPQKSDVRFNICDAIFWYGYEYLGNGARLVITPLTDRIYVTATQALHLKMGCAPAGPAGTGKTETTKDLASALGKACYVFNCSDQMDYRTMGDIFKGLASSGSWGCFDEFNRLVPEVLSVCSVQFKSVTDAIKQKSIRFELQGDEIDLDPTCGAFITMNPGYLGRSELPEGLKALFRPITVVVPDLELICENMLMAEGFIEAKILARKFTVLYKLCKDLLSKQDHYDWGLRAIKSVLVVAGGFKRAEPELPEQALLMRALRDFNIPKIVAEDYQIFRGLLGDLFPGLDPPRKRNMEFETIIEEASLEAKLWPEPKFILKVVQLAELLEIRHCVFVMGPPGAGKSSTWKILAKAKEKSGQKTTTVDINPKSISADELYGFMILATREWKDGLLSKTMRDLGNVADTNPKWIILDGDLDANWIESMNSVMDDNKILTLASNERIPLKPHMRMIFEIRDLKFATPATVSRAGILYISDTEGYQWKAYANSWVAERPYQLEVKEALNKLFEKYIDATLLYIKKHCKFVIPYVEINLVISLCNILESLLGPEPNALEYWFVFSTIWALSGGLTEKDSVDYRKVFSGWWRQEWKTIKFPGRGTVFDYFVDSQANKLEEWQVQLKTIEYDSTTQVMQNITVPTIETISNSYFMENLIKIHKHILLIGTAGCGKTQLVKGTLASLNVEKFTSCSINMNFYTDSILLQNQLEQPLQKTGGRLWAPQGTLQLIYFIDDLNMPQLDPYNTQNSIELIRQHMDYSHWYSRNNLSLKDIAHTQYIAAMNPTAGSFYVNPRLQRHFWLLAVTFPEQNSLNTIYSTFMAGHFNKRFKANVVEITSPIIKAALLLHQSVVQSFRKTAINFHYEFNIRHISNVFQGLLVAQPAQFQDQEKLVKLWIHESERIYGDRLVTEDNLLTYRAIVADLVKKQFTRFNLAKYFQKDQKDPLVFCHFAGGLVEKVYEQINSYEQLLQVLMEALKEYNDTNATMDLVLFEDAMKHVCSISRIINNPSGHALLVGVGGSGKQSLSRLSAFICGYATKQITISASYDLPDLKADLQDMYNKSGLKDEGINFLFTEGQITKEKFLVYINDLLSSGEVADLFAQDEKDQISNTLTPAVKGAGIQPTQQNIWNFFIDRVKKNLHMSLCFSPVGDSFRNRARKFPALVNCTVIDWFQPWPKEALTSVAGKFLSKLELGDENVRTNVVKFMPFSFTKVNEISQKMLEQERRYCYTTPKSFLELIKLFTSMLTKRRQALEDQKERLSNGLIKLQQTAEIVAELEENLKVTLIDVEEKSKAADAFAENVGKEKAKVTAQSEIASKEADNCGIIQKEVEEKKASCEQDLANALPLVEKAQAALDTIQKKDFQEAKALKSPPQGVDDVFIAVMCLMVTIDPTIEADKQGRVKDKQWKSVQKMINNPQAFVDNLKGFKSHIDQGTVPAQNFKAVRPFIALDYFNKATIEKKSAAAAGLCEWVLNIVMYYDVVQEVEPKREALRTANAQLQAANEKLQEMNELVKNLEEKLAVLVAQYDKAMGEKKAAEDELQKNQSRLDLANRLIKALGSENQRWALGIENLDFQLGVIVGDVLLASSFVSYVGPFNKKFRNDLINSIFIPFLQANKIPMTENLDPLKILTDEATIAKWNSQKLPSDPVSIENGAICTNSERYPLLIDPQLQAIAWIKEKEQSNKLEVTRLGTNKIIKVLENSLYNGNSVLIENIDEQIDASIMPVIARNTIKRGNRKVIKLGEQEINLNDNFKLFLQTKLSNPHYPPEIQAETTLINFTVTEKGLEDQLLSLVVRKERPDLAQKREDLIQEQNAYKIQLKELEEDLLYRLTNAKGFILDDVELIENLEKSKMIATDVEEKMVKAVETNELINTASETYRIAATRGALIFFLMNELFKIHSFYMYSLESYLAVIKRAIDIVAKKYRDEAAKKNEVKGSETQRTEESRKEGEGEGDVEAEEKKTQDQVQEVEPELTPRSLKKRVLALIDSITYESYAYIRRGLFEKHKLIVVTMLTLRILVRTQQIDAEECSHLIQGKLALDIPPPPEQLSWLTDQAWAASKALEQLTSFTGLCQQIDGDNLQWKKWYGDEKAELADLPRSYKEASQFTKLLLLRAMRPDRLSAALVNFVINSMGLQYIEQMPFSMQQTYSETSKMTPIFFVLFPGVDPTPEVERLGEQLKITAQNGLFKNISMGQGQEPIAEQWLTNLAQQGGWVMLQNVHLMQSWLKTLEGMLEKNCPNAHDNFRCIISSEPPPLPDMKIIPESILQNCIKIANEAPQSLKANLRRAYAHFKQETIDRSTKQNEFKVLLFALCFFHSLVLGRRKFASQGWSRHYSFNDGDLKICADVLYNYLENYEQVPYDDIKYIYGEIMYGGHITDDWDRRTNNTYLRVLIKPELLTGMYLAPLFKSPDPNKYNYASYTTLIEEKLPTESPQMFGLHPNAEIGYLTQQGENIFSTILEVQGGAAQGGKGGKKDDVVNLIINEFLGKLPENFNMIEIQGKAKVKTPEINVCFQECDRMNELLSEIKRSLLELQLGLQGALNITEAMENLSTSLSINRVPGGWEKKAYWSKKQLAAWFVDLLERIHQLNKWQEELILPNPLWISGLFNPMSFLTAIMQTTARSKGLPLDNMTLQTNVTGWYNNDEITSKPETGAYISGLFLEGAAWELGRSELDGYLIEQTLKDLHPRLPIVNAISVPLEEKRKIQQYNCPVYVTSMRGPTYVFSANLNMENEDEDEAKWILSGTCLLMSDD